MVRAVRHAAVHASTCAAGQTVASGLHLVDCFRCRRLRPAVMPFVWLDFVFKSFGSAAELN